MNFIILTSMVIGAIVGGLFIYVWYYVGISMYKELLKANRVALAVHKDNPNLMAASMLLAEGHHKMEASKDKFKLSVIKNDK